MTVGGSTSTSGTLNTKVVQTGTQKFVWNDFSMPVLTANGTIDNTNYTYACAFKGSGGSTAGNVYNAFNNNTANYFGFTATDTDTRVLVFYTPYKLKVSSVIAEISTNTSGSLNEAFFEYCPRQTTLPSSYDDLNAIGSYYTWVDTGTTITNISFNTSSKTNYSNYHCFRFSAYNFNTDKYIQARLYCVILQGKYQDGYQQTSGTADFTKPAYSVVKDGSIYKAIL